VRDVSLNLARALQITPISVPRAMGAVGVRLRRNIRVWEVCLGIVVVRVGSAGEIARIVARGVRAGTELVVVMLRTWP